MKFVKKCALILSFIFILNSVLPSLQVLRVQATETNTSDQDTKLLKANSEAENIEAYSASTIAPIVVLKNPIENQYLTESFIVKGYAVSNNVIKKVGIYVDNVYIGDATIGLDSSEGQQKYPSYPNSGTSGFSLKLIGLTNGVHLIKAVAVDEVALSTSVQASTNISNIKTNIMGKGTLNKNQMINEMMFRNPKLTVQYIKDFVSYLISEANVEGVNYDVLYGLMMLETGFLNYGGDVKPSQNNFGGLGAVGNGVTGESFVNVKIGIRAVTQHLKAYSSSLPLNQNCVDSRFQYVLRESSPYVEWLGIQENPDGRGWAGGYNYGTKINNLIAKSRTYSTAQSYSEITNFVVDGTGNVGDTLTVKATATPSLETLYKIVLLNMYTGKWTVLSDWSTKSSVNYIPRDAAVHRFIVLTKNIKKTSIVEDDKKTIDKVIKTNVTTNKSTINSVSITGDTYVNSTLNIAVSATPSEGTLYKIVQVNMVSGKWTILSDWSTSSSVKYIPKYEGTHRFIIRTRNIKKATTVEDDKVTIDKVITTNKSVINSVNITGDKKLGSTLNIAISATPEAETLYKIVVVEKSTGKWQILSDWTTKNTVNYTPKTQGDYTIIARVKNKSKTGNVEDQIVRTDISITNKKLIVIDPGHGGTEPGANYTFTSGNYLEKDLNLKVALLLRTQLINKGYDVVMTRIADTTVELYDRPRLANNINADLLISIHFNAYTEASAHGVEVLYSTKAMDDVFRNEILAKGEEDPSNNYTSKVNTSSKMASEMAAKISTSTGLYNRGGKDQSLAVCRNSKMPAVLVEGGFLSNQTEAEYVSKIENQQKIANSISDVVSIYIK